MSKSTLISTSGGFLLSSFFHSTIFTTCLSAATGATVAYFATVFWKYQMSNLNEKIEIQKKLKSLIPFIQKKHQLEKQIKKIENNNHQPKK